MATHKRGDDGLTDKERLFVDEYFRRNLNATRAYAKVYGKTKLTSTVVSAASQLRHKPHVDAEIRRRLDSAMDDTRRAELAKKIVDTLERRSFFDVGEYLNSDGMLRMPLDKFKEHPDLAHVLDGYKVVQTQSGPNVEVKFPNRERALESLAKLAGLELESTQDTSITIHLDSGEVAL